MKLAKALKEKNRLVGEVNRLKGLILRENSKDVKSSSKVDVASLFSQLDAATKSLIAIKTAIFKANVGIYEKIVTLGELKTRIEWIKTIPNKNGTEDTQTFRDTIITREYRAYKTQEDIDNEIASLQIEIDKIQDAVDEYNATVSVEL